MCDGARLCYKSKELTDRTEQEKFISRLLKSNPPHESPIEHSCLSVKFVTNRGITHELVRHRLISPSQESTRYCNYSNDRFDNNVTFIIDRVAIGRITRYLWEEQCRECEREYFERLALGCKPEEARGVLNNDVKSEIKVTANYREWMHLFRLRCDKHAHYQMRELTTPLLKELSSELPLIFGPILEQVKKED